MTAPVIGIAVLIEDSQAGSRPKEAAVELRDELTRRLPSEAVPGPDAPTPGAKGWETDLVNIGVALINGGVVTQLIVCLRSFFARDMKRSVTITDAQGREIRVDATNVGDEVVIQAIEAAAASGAP